MTTLLAGGYGPDSDGTAEGVSRLTLGRDGSLAVEGLVVPAVSPSWLHVDGDVLVAAAESTAQLVSWRLIDGVPQAGASVATGGAPCHLVSVGDELLAACYVGGVLDAASLADGLPTGAAVTALRDAGSGPHPAQDSAHVHGALPLADGRVLVADLGTDEVVVLHRTAEGWSRAGALTLPAGTGPRDLVDLGDERVLVLGELSCEVLLLDTGTDVPTVLAAIALPGAVDADHAAALALHPTEDGVLIHSGLRGTNLIAVVRLAGDRLEAVGSVSCGGDWPRHLLAVDGYLLSSNQRSGDVAVFRLGAGGLPIAVGPAVDVPSPTHLLPVDDTPWSGTPPVS